MEPLRLICHLLDPIPHRNVHGFVFEPVSSILISEVIVLES
jgi:hypothetical protein